MGGEGLYGDAMLKDGFYCAVQSRLVVLTCVLDLAVRHHEQIIGIQGERHFVQDTYDGFSLLD
jgi:hypothetical protein